MSVAAVFPGQGSQKVGMGQSLIAQSEVARELFARADDILGFGLSKVLAEGPIEELTLTQNTQPALLVNSFAAFSAAEINVDAAAGHSLGEFTALVAAKALSFDDAVLLVNKRGRYMQEAVPSGEGKMLAVMGPSEEEILQTARSIEGIVEVANINSPGQTVVAGEASAIDAFSEAGGQAGFKIIPLNVSAPFHCSLMKPAADKLAADLDQISFSDPTFPVYANVTANQIVSGDEARELLKQQVCGTVRWSELMQNMVSEKGVDQIIEFGEGVVLSKLMKRIDKSVRAHSVSDVESAKSVAAAI